MSWYTKVWLFSVLAQVAFASSHQLKDSGKAASVVTQEISSRDLFPPLEISLSVPNIEVNEAEDGFHSIRAQGLYPTQIYGTPELLGDGVLIAVPEGFEPQVEVVDVKTQDLPVVVRPSQRKFRCHSPHAMQFFFNSALYNSAEIYPKNVYSLENVGRLGALRLVRVGLQATQMNFATRKLTVTTDLKLKVSFVSSGEFQVSKLSQPHFDLIKSIVANTTSLNKMAEPEAGPELILIVVADSYKNAIQPLVEWKHSKGMLTKVVTYTEAGATKEAVKQYIQNYYNSSAIKPSYLLMVGNKTNLPPFMEPTGSGSAASDIRFAQVSGSDFIPDLFHGRLVADTEAELNQQMSRWIQYERDAKEESWYPQASTIASSDTQGGHPYDNEYSQMILDDLKKNTYKKGDLFWQGDQTATSSNITSAVNEGRTWLTYIGHGSGTGWGSTNDSFTNSNVASLKNSDKLLFLTDVACMNGNWVGVSKCFGKAWVTQTHEGKNAGAVAYYGGSVNISWHEPALMSTGIAKYHFEKSLSSVGATVLAGQLYLIEKMGSGANVQDNLEWYNLLSDPSLSLRTATPTMYQVKHQVKKAKNGIVVDVEALTTSGKPVSGLSVALNKADAAAIATGKTDASGKTSLTISGTQTLEPNSKITLTGYNFASVQRSVN